MSIVAVSQALGSLGEEIGLSLSAGLGYQFVDREIVGPRSASARA